MEEGPAPYSAPKPASSGPPPLPASATDTSQSAPTARLKKPRPKLNTGPGLAQAPPPATEDDGVFRYGSLSITEAEYRRACVHNVIRWTLAWTVIAPVMTLFLIFAPLGFVIRLVAAMGLASGLFALFTNMLPGSKLCHTDLFRRCKAHREVLAERKKAAAKAAS